MLKSLTTKILTLTLASLLAFGIFTVTPANSVMAQDDYEHEFTLLELAYEAQRTIVANMGNRFEFADEISEAMGEWSDGLESFGQDTRELDQARANFEQAMVDARREYDLGAAIVNDGNGFDASGQVTDPAAAFETVLEARNHLSEARWISIEAMVELRNAYEELRADFEAQFSS